MTVHQAQRKPWPGKPDSIGKWRADWAERDSECNTCRLDPCVVDSKRHDRDVTSKILSRLR